MAMAILIELTHLSILVHVQIKVQGYSNNVYIIIMLVKIGDIYRKVTPRLDRSKTRCLLRGAFIVGWATSSVVLRISVLALKTVAIL